jgi:hypothetical protein
MIHYSPYKFDKFELKWSQKIGASVTYVGLIGDLEWFAAVSASPWSRDQYLEYGGFTDNGVAVSYIRELQPNILEKLYATELYRYVVRCKPENHENLVHGVEFVCRSPPTIIECKFADTPIQQLLESAGVVIYKYGDPGFSINNNDS